MHPESNNPIYSNNQVDTMSEYQLVQFLSGKIGELLEAIKTKSDINRIQALKEEVHFLQNLVNSGRSNGIS